MLFTAAITGGPISRELRRIAGELTSRYFDGIEALSRRLGAAILGGSAPRETSHEIVNTALLAFPD